MNKIKQVTLADRIRAAVESFKAGKPKHSIQLGIDVKRYGLCSEKTRQVKTFGVAAEGFLTLDHDSGVLSPTCEQDLMDHCVRQLAEALRKSGAITFNFKQEEGAPPPFNLQRIQCAARLEVVMPEQKEAQPNE